MRLYRTSMQPVICSFPRNSILSACSARGSSVGRVGGGVNLSLFSFLPALFPRTRCLLRIIVNEPARLRMYNFVHTQTRNEGRASVLSIRRTDRDSRVTHNATSIFAPRGASSRRVTSLPPEENFASSQYFFSLLFLAVFNSYMRGILNLSFPLLPLPEIFQRSSQLSSILNCALSDC